MVLGIPTVATDVGGSSEIICHMENGILVPAGKPKIMAEAVLKLINDKKLRDNIGNNAKKCGVKYSLSLMVSRPEEYFKKLVHS
jgi:glycosyltransferase involved in cell wall biosynthesis